MWRTARLTLMPKGKGKDRNDPRACRPLCLLSTFSKLYEDKLKERLRRGIERTKDESNRWCALVLFDIKNAFNTATWSLIIRELIRRRVSRYLIEIVQEYLEEIYNKVGAEERAVTEGVPQGSNFGPDLWNLYNGVLDVNSMEAAKSIATADDLVLIVRIGTYRKMNGINATTNTHEEAPQHIERCQPERNRKKPANTAEPGNTTRTHPLSMPKVGEESPGAHPNYTRRGNLREYDSHNGNEQDKLGGGTRIYHHDNWEIERRRESRAEQIRGHLPVTSRECLTTKPE
ncbi:hypothetical protein JTB14_037820 [Gonioctena quinquepunctata]|nr:hypothetical protein JTB14_037820 [Gonioctena quinquepunctata]